MGLRDLAYILTNMITGEGYLNKDVETHFHERRCQRLLDIFVGTGKLAGQYFYTTFPYYPEAREYSFKNMSIKLMNLLVHPL